MEDFYIKCNSKEESELCEKWAINNNLRIQNRFGYNVRWNIFVVKDNYYTLNYKNYSITNIEDICINLPEKTLADLGISITTKETITDSKFIVGKWYCNSEKIYAKVDSIINNNTFNFKEWISAGHYTKCNYNWNYHDQMKEASLEEIQPYLPDNHPDKIPNKVEIKTMETPEFKVGDYIYIIKANKDEYSEAKKEFNGDILKITSITKEKLQYVNSYWITHEGNSFSGGGFRMNGNGYIPNIHFRLATQEEIDSVTKPKEITESTNPIPNQYDLSTTITRAVKNNDPSIIVKETGKSVEELCDLIDEKTSSCLTDGDDADCRRLHCKDCPFSSRNGATKESAKAWLRSKSKQSLSDYQAVHVDTQEKWDFVSEKLEYTSKWMPKSRWNRYEKNSSINLKRVGFGTEGIAYNKVISFEDWLNLTGYADEWYSSKKGSNLDIDNPVFKDPLIFEECFEEKPEFSLFPNFVSKIN